MTHSQKGRRQHTHKVKMSTKRADEINCQDPRITAAMKVLGITEENLSPREFRPKDSSEAGEAMAKLRFEKHEAQRQRWIKEVKDAAAEINEADVAALMNQTSTSLPSQLAQNFENTSMERMEKQKQKLEEQRNRNRSEIQRALEEKMNSEQKTELKNKREEEQRKRILELRKEQKMKVQSQAEQRRQRTNKNHENLLAIAQTAREKMRELDTKLKKVGRAAWEKAQSARSGDEQKRREQREGVEKRIEAKNSKYEKSLNERLELYQAQIEREEEMEKRLVEQKEQRLQKAETARAKFAERIRNLHQEHADEEMKRHNKGFKDLTEKLDSGKQRAEELMKARVQGLVEGRTSRHTKAQMNQEAQKEEDKQKMRDARKKFQEKVQAPGTSRSMGPSETRYKVSESLDITNELVLTNKERINLADDHRREQAIARLHANAARHRVFQQERATVDLQRQNIQKENMIDKSAMRIALGGIRDPSPKKVNELLKTLDLPLLKLEDSNAGETEGQTQQ